MSFTRTTSGINNTPKFLGVDRTVYVEGTGDDQRFWQAVFNVAYSGTLCFHFKSVGGRTTVLQYAQSIASGKTSNIIAILDSDYEGLMFSTLPIPNILYTFGYSFENDLFTFKQAIKIASQMHCGIGSTKFRKLLNSLRTASNEVSKLALLDFVAHINGHYLLDKNGNTCRLNIKNNASGVICIKSIQSQRSDAKLRGISFATRPSREIRNCLTEHPKYRWVYGHLWRALFVKCIGDELRKTSSVSINPKAIENLAISNISDTRGKIFTQTQFTFYKKVLSRLQ